jgi:hypothetical protein
MIQQGHFEVRRAMPGMASASSSRALAHDFLRFLET